MIALPPLEAGAVNATLALVELTAEAVTPVGAPGTVRGVADTIVEVVPYPAALVADIL